MSVPETSPFPSLRRFGAGLLLVALFFFPRPSAAQDHDRLRIGITFGGTSTIGATFEYQWRSRSVEINVGTWRLRDISLSVVGKQYMGPEEDFRPFVGGGLWGVVAFTDEGRGSVLVARAPVGAEWRFVSSNFLTTTMNLNRGLWVDRVDPEDDTPLNRRLVPLPGFDYRWRP